ncbi:DUF2167 domain-containing protein [Flavobacterium sp.]|uniref:DUF2167 domain-containing protein n=1 Tax=Flavobacterium sp. TaxID=239 RepID=UPI002B4B5DD7|nr:DUF2167 domain-containing protein [Flavobacterium sp.]HLF52084.1 DUF2167 domain-containing protein [Flavobacterium sp.]
MRKSLLIFILLFGITFLGYAQNEDSTAVKIADIEKSLVYQTGIIKLTSGNATLNVPKGFKFLDAKQAQYVMKDLWGNPEDLTLLGALVPESKGVLGENSWLFTINYDEMGFVKDDDAKDVDYDDLLKDIQEDVKNENIERKKLNFPTAELIGWASKPYYDEDKKILHWAKEFHFENETANTLNYDLRVLGRKGVFIFSAVAPIKQLPEVKANINNVISSIEFDKGSNYADFDADTDTVAAWTIGGLVAGKVLAKVGFFALILKFWKVGMLAIAAGWAAFKRFYKGKKDPISSDLSKNTESKDSDSNEE